ncbi:hypothetical protein WA577_003981 [Blastocystis sp. JDR]
MSAAAGTFSFPILPDREILDNMKQLGIPMEAKDLSTPNTKNVLNTFISLMSISSGLPVDEIVAYDKENAKKYGLENNQHLISAITLFGPLSDFMAVCRVRDFSLADLLRPTAARFREQLSAAINFIMFSDVVIDQLRVYRDKKNQLSEKIRSIEYDIKVQQGHKAALESQKQRDRGIVVDQKEKNKRLEEEIEKLNIEQQRLKENNNAIKVEMKEITKLINVFEQQIKDENQTTLELSDRIIASPRKLTQDVADMKNDYARYTSECRTLSLQATDMEGQHAIMTAAEKRLEDVVKELEEIRGKAEKRKELVETVETTKNRIKEVKQQIADATIEEKKMELQRRRQDEGLKTLQVTMATTAKSSAEKLVSLQSENETLRSELEALTTQVKELEAAVEAEEESMRKMEQATSERILMREELMRSLMERMKAYQQALMEVVRSPLCYKHAIQK